MVLKNERMANHFLFAEAMGRWESGGVGGVSGKLFKFADTVWGQLSALALRP